jgi:hypothetical protein
MLSSEEESRASSDLNRTAAYRFIVPPWAGRPVSWAGSGTDLAWPGQIRPAPSFLLFPFFSVKSIAEYVLSFNSF